MPEAIARRVEPEVVESPRLTRRERRDALLDAAVEIVTSGDVAAVSMEAVAERAGVSRPLVYKHFANRSELLAAVYRREARGLHLQLAREVGAAESVEGMFRALIDGALHAADERGRVFAALRSAGGWNRELRHEQRVRDIDTVRAFAARAERELGIARHEATAATATLLATIEPVLAQWRLRPTREHAALLEDVYMGMVRGVLDELQR
ncbi:MAG TPA: helix-turn-helix domain-containing protein [Acidimicrobiia bacterium]|nr:helix-turn-helix domain-containing protein [Acidimicrobiia bacterium]